MGNSTKKKNYLICPIIDFKSTNLQKYNHIPVGYIQRIIVKSVLTIPDEHTIDHKVFSEKTKHSDSMDHLTARQLYLIDAFRTSIAHAFEINEYLRAFRDEQGQSLVNDLCLHVGELKAVQKKKEKRPTHDADDTYLEDDNIPESEESTGKNYFPEFNCLYLSPANFWSNDIDSFLRDTNIMRTINELNDLQADAKSMEGKATTTTAADKDSSFSLLTGLLSFFDRINLSSGTIVEKITSTSSSELLFGVSRNTMLSLLKDNTKVAESLANDAQISAKLNRSVVFTYAITIAFRRYDREFIEKLNAGLQARFSHREQAGESANTGDKKITNLQYTNQSFLYYIPYLVLYFLLFLYIYISVRKIELVKSKWGLAFAAVAQVILLLSCFVKIGALTKGVDKSIDKDFRQCIFRKVEMAK